MNFIKTTLEDLYLIEPSPFIDERGQFFRAFCAEEFKEIGHEKPFVQINHSINTHKGTFRGFHFQLPPSAEAKLVRCIRGKVLDIIIDLRKGSPTLLQAYKVELSAENKKMIYIPVGFAHGFLTLENQSELLYHHTDYYQPKIESGLRYNDPLIKLDFEIHPEIISDKDLSYPLLKDTFTGI